VKKIDFLEPLIIDGPEEEINGRRSGRGIVDETGELINDEEEVNGEVENEIKRKK